MSKIDDYISKRSQDSSEFAQAVTQYNINLEVAVQVKQLRDSLGLTQRKFANLVNKPQSTIARIENGSFNASTMLLSEIAQAVNRKVKIESTHA
ncbi:DNA-binding transcriptional regulator, XRE-family HTH domain [Lactobacillus bombicola]|uniref:DNA-binding transcriptional regulator, XRE-family HTH domain n=1 Tax=Lactobacillus bombicola TaxID=1505723 RepID=A0A1I1SDD1_9LACO|nr:helix-turn-helix transcriptional regulator [Lactobacillus bombicola]MCO6527747.1 helix-turn-helix transcriptional regulator [Lactobacillus sp.]SFD44486.1 DNA-binding transcriptional regulator, XRE-family HTH domain [Lactobacillus bombicola]